MDSKVVERIREVFREKLPGRDAQLRMAPENKVPDYSVFPSSTVRNSSVMILLYFKENHWMFPLIKRPDYNGFHGGQISLPGGKCEEGDKDNWYTAVRETIEETGVRENIGFIGELSPLFIPRSGYMVYPQVGIVDTPPQFHPDAFEVDFLIEASISDLFRPNVVEKFSFQAGEQCVSAPCYHMHGCRVWGATAMILSEFQTLLSPIKDLFNEPSHFCNARISPGSPSHTDRVLPLDNSRISQQDH